jgi:hypothetical protein
MASETSLRRFSLFAQLAHMGNDEPPPSGMKPKIHWIGQKTQQEQKPSPRGKRGEESPKKKNERGYRQLSSITLTEVDDAYKYYANQLVYSPAPAWIAPNYFCMIHLRARQQDWPPAVFGRVKTSYPSDGYIQNIQELELELPSKERSPDLVHLRVNDIYNTSNKPLQSFCVRVKFLLHPDEQAEFSGQESPFVQQGFLPEFSNGYLDLFDINEHNHASSPWLYVIGSRWFSSIPLSVQPEIREKLAKLAHWNKLIFNYHPEYVPSEIRTLNRELGFKAGYTEIFLIEPENPGQTIQIVSKTFDKLFDQPMK